MTPPSTAVRTTKPPRLRRLIVESKPKEEAGPRLPGLDALRSASMVAVVAAHAAYAYASCQVAGLPWAVRDRSRSYAYDLLTWSAISWAMPAFFALGGLAASALWSSRGPRGFVRDRLRRIVTPALVAIPTVLGPALLVWSAGWLISGRTSLQQILNQDFIDRELRENRIGPAHLWFLEYLILMLVAFILVHLASRRQSRPAPGWTFSWAGPFVMAIPTSLILWVGHAINGLDPIMDMRNSFVPNPLRWLHHAWFFAVGTRLYESRGDLARLTRHAPAFLALALPVFAIRSTLLRADVDVMLDGPAAWALVGSAALFGWLTLFGSIGLFLRVFDRQTPAIRYMADASYWIYLTHFPIVGLAQIGMYNLPWTATAKFLVALSVTLGFGLLSYQGAVRHTALGRWLHGPRGRPGVLPR